MSLTHRPSRDDGPLDRTFSILEFIADQKKAVSTAEIAATLSLPVPTAHRLIGNLEDRGLVQKALGTKRYLIGSKMLTLSAKAIGSSFRTARRHAVLRAVAAEIGEQCEIGTIRDNQVAYVDSVRMTQPHELQFDPGIAAAPLHCTSTGKIYMSRLPARARYKLVHSLSLERRTDNTIVDPDALLIVLETTRRQGWAASNEEFVKGVVGCAVPILSPEKTLIACLGVSVPVARVTFSDLIRFIAPLQRAATLLSETILKAEDDFEEY